MEHRHQLQTEQIRRLRQHAHETGDYSGLVYFLACRGDVAGLKSLAVEAALSKRDLLAVEIMTDPRRLTLPRCLESLQDPWIAHTAAKVLLGTNRLDDALAVVERSLEGGSAGTSVLNLVMHHLRRSGAKELAENLADISLQLSPRQEDVREARAGTHARAQELYLEALPKPAPCAFYLPAYNMSGYLAEAIEGALAQSHPLEAFFVVDDGSTDDTAQIAAQYPVILLRHETNRGLAAARNTAFAASPAPWLASVDADAFPAPDFLQYLFMELENAEPAVAGAGGKLLERNTGTPADLWRSLHLSQNPGPQRVQPPAFLFGSNTVYRCRDIAAVGGYDERFRTNAEDGDMAQRLIAAGRTFVYTPHATAWHLRRDTPASVIRMFWGWAHDTLEKRGALDSLEQVLLAMEHRVHEMVTLINGDLAAGHACAAYIDMLYCFGCGLISLDAAAERGHCSRGAAAYLQRALMDTLAPLGAMHDDRLERRMRADLAAFLMEDEPVAPAAAHQARFDQVAQALLEVYNALEPAVYEVLAEKA